MTETSEGRCEDCEHKDSEDLYFFCGYAQRTPGMFGWARSFRRKIILSCALFREKKR